MGFEPTPTFVDQNSLSGRNHWSYSTWVWRLRPLGHPDLGLELIWRQYALELQSKTKSAPGEVWTHNLRIAHTRTDYKYGALTYCATGANALGWSQWGVNNGVIENMIKELGLPILIRLSHWFHSRMLSHYYSVWRLWAAVFRPWPVSPLLRQPGDQGLPLGRHIDTKLSADILSTWRSMRKDPWPQVIH